MKRVRHLFAVPQPDGNGYQVSYEIGNSRRLHPFSGFDSTAEKMPHGAGSFHDPEQHQVLMERIENYTRLGQP